MKTQTQTKVQVLSQTQFNTKQTAGTLEEGVVYKIKGTPQAEITSTNKLSADLVASGTTNVVPTATDAANWNAKQDALPTTTTADLVLKSTSTAGTVEWGEAGSSVTVSSSGVTDGTNTYNASDKMDKANPTGTGALSINRKASTTVGTNSVAIGNDNTASGTNSVAVGNGNTASGPYCYAEGWSNTSSGTDSHAEGYGNTSSGTDSHAEGHSNTASGGQTHVEGYHNTASGAYSHAEGCYTTANHESQHVFGEYNVLDSSSAAATRRGTYIEIVGNGTGTASSSRSNARTLDWNGNEILAGKLTVGAAPTANMDVTTKQYVDNKDSILYNNASGVSLGNLKFVKCSQDEYEALSTVDNNTLYIIINKYTITGTATNATINSSTSYSGTIKDGETITLTVGADGSSYKLPTTVTVSGATYVYTRTSDTAGTIALSNPTASITVDVTGVSV